MRTIVAGMAGEGGGKNLGRPNFRINRGNPECVRHRGYISRAVSFVSPCTVVLNRREFYGWLVPRFSLLVCPPSSACTPG